MIRTLRRIFALDIDPNRIYGLDILRAVAILSVVFVHGAGILSPKAYAQTAMLLPDGVSIFFVLSGFLIGGILIRQLERGPFGRRELLQFWKRRWMRTLPLYGVVLVLLIVLSARFDSQFRIREALPFFLFLQNFWKNQHSFFAVSWSLSVEEWFYLLIPLALSVLLGLSHFKPKLVLLGMIISGLGLAILFRYFRYISFPALTEELYVAFFRNVVVTRMDGILVGLLMAWIMYYHGPVAKRFQPILCWIGMGLHVGIKIGAATWFYRDPFFYSNLLFPLESIATAALIPFLSGYKRTESLLSPLVVHISLISYSMYLVHAQIVQDWLIPLPAQVGIQLPTWILYMLFWGLTLGISTLTYRYIELPFMRWR
jgi:peptidoglycan/LPS O-acetylase OafA/YrhL